MISVKKDFKNLPSKLDGKRYIKKLEILIEENTKHEFSGYYNDSSVFEKLITIYNGKCGYCETPMNAGYKLQVEHYRPKKKVVEDESHNGYYWLGYEWSNLLLACPKCNQQGAKGNCFPIKGKRVNGHDKFLTNGKLDLSKCHSSKSPLIDEEPLFLNPEIDEVEKHLVFLPNGEVKGITEKGKKTIEICNLNSKEKRDDLIIARKKIVDKILENIRKFLNDYIQKKISKETFKYSLENIFLDIIKGQDRDNAYSRVYFFIYNKFEIFILRQLGDKQKDLVGKIFLDFRLNLEKY